MNLLNIIVDYVHAHPVILGAVPTVGGVLFTVVLVLTAAFGSYTDAQMADLMLTDPRAWGIKKLMKILLPFAGQLFQAIYAIATNRTPPSMPDAPTMRDPQHDLPKDSRTERSSRTSLAWAAFALVWCAVVVSGCAVAKAACSPIVLDAEKVACGLIVDGEHLTADDVRDARQRAAMRRVEAMDRDAGADGGRK